MIQAPIMQLIYKGAAGGFKARRLQGLFELRLNLSHGRAKYIGPIT